MGINTETVDHKYGDKSHGSICWAGLRIVHI